MSRKDEVVKAEERKDDIVKETPALQVVSNEQLIHLKLDRILEILSTQKE